MAYATAHRPAVLAVFSWVSTLRMGLTESWSRYDKYRRTYDELDALNDRELADINISRCDIRAIAAEAAYGA